MMRFRPLTAAALDGLYAFAAPIWHDCYRGILPAEQIDFLLDKYFAPSAVRAYVAAGMRYEYIEVDGVDAGFFAYRTEADHTYLDKLYLKAEYRGRHIASAVFDALLARHRLPLRLNVNRGNTVAQRAYYGRGFRRIGRETIDLGSGFVNEDDILEKPFLPAQDGRP